MNFIKFRRFGEFSELHNLTIIPLILVLNELYAKISMFHSVAWKLLSTKPEKPVIGGHQLKSAVCKFLSAPYHAGSQSPKATARANRPGISGPFWALAHTRFQVRCSRQIEDASPQLNNIYSSTIPPFMADGGMLLATKHVANAACLS